LDALANAKLGSVLCFPDVMTFTERRERWTGSIQEGEIEVV
jgi:hypothetical protein